MSVAEIIEKRLCDHLNLTFLEVRNDSDRHKGHAGDDGSGETHFVITIQSPELDTLPLLTRHRRIHEVLGKDLLNKIHSLSIKFRK